MNQQQIEQIVQTVLNLILGEVASIPEVVSALNKSSPVIVAVASVLMPILDEAKSLFPQYAIFFDLMEDVYKDAQTQGLIK